MIVLYQRISPVILLYPGFFPLLLFMNLALACKADRTGSSIEKSTLNPEEPYFPYKYLRDCLFPCRCAVNLQPSAPGFFSPPW